MDYLIYVAPLLLCLAWYGARRWMLMRTSRIAHKESEEAGLSEPMSLHPVVDAVKCIGCGSCIKACPEMPAHAVLGLLEGKASLVSPTSCIGHGACRTACPVDAITLVFGSARRGVDLPRVSPWFETNVPGVFVAGELGGMGLIRNAIEQGRQAVAQIVARRPRGAAGMLDLVIVGAGPAGFAASLAAMQSKLKFKTVETQPADLPLVGKFKFTLTSKEDLLKFWQEAQRRTGLIINCNERVESVTREANGFTVRTTRGEYRAASVLLAVGRRGTPRKLGIPGEELSKVTYRLIEAEQYAGQRVLVVGGGDSALEAAASLAEASASVTLSYRGDAFQRAKQRNRERVDAAIGAGQLQVLLKSEVKAITEERVAIVRQGQGLHLPNDVVIVNAGGVLPTDLLRQIGIEVVTKWGTA